VRPGPAAILRVVRGGAPGAPARVSDADIIEAFAAGDRRAAALVYDRLVGVVDATLFRVIGRREADHDDLIQASFEQIILTLSRKSFAGGCSLTGWAASIACHVGLNAIRSRTRARRVFVPQGDVSEARAEAMEAESGQANFDVEAQVEARREIDRVRQHLAAMDPTRAETVMLHDVFAVSLAETARLTGVSMAAAQSRLVRGRRELRERMAATHGRREDGEP
jgi:RNA polymerase sigma-70 factor (ECF subfamily)